MRFPLATPRLLAYEEQWKDLGELPSISFPVSPPEGSRLAQVEFRVEVGTLHEGRIDLIVDNMQLSSWYVATPQQLDGQALASLSEGTHTAHLKLQGTWTYPLYLGACEFPPPLPVLHPVTHGPGL